jgi:hypothetical protein
MKEIFVIVKGRFDEHPEEIIKTDDGKYAYYAHQYTPVGYEEYRLRYLLIDGNLEELKEPKVLMTNGDYKEILVPEIITSLTLQFDIEEIKDKYSTKENVSHKIRYVNGFGAVDIVYLVSM